MEKIPPQQEKVLNVVFSCLLMLSLLLFAGIPAIEQARNITEMTQASNSAHLK